MDFNYTEITQHWSTYDNAILMEIFGGGVVNVELHNNKKGKMAFIYGLYVCEGCRKDGLATELLKMAELIARRNGHDEVYLDWKESESPNWVLEWYLRNGYEKSSSGKGYFRLRKRLRHGR